MNDRTPTTAQASLPNTNMIGQSVPDNAFHFRLEKTAGITLENGDRRAVDGVAYSGESLNHWWWDRVVFDLDSTDIAGTVPLLINHDPDQRAGFGQMHIDAKRLHVTGELLKNSHGQAVAADSDDGFPWQMSVFIEPSEIVEMADGKTATINGREASGPLTIFRQNQIREISFCPVGVDGNTTAAVMSRQKNHSIHTKPNEANQMGQRLASFLNDQIGDGDDRSDIISSMASEAGIEENTVNDILNATIQCPPIERLRGFARALDVSIDSIAAAAKEDGCEYEGFSAKPEPAASGTGDQSIKAARTEERDRIRSILSDAAAAGREKLALRLAVDTSIDASQAKQILLSAPRTSPASGQSSQFSKYMESIGNPTVGADAGEPTDNETSQAIQTGWAHAFGHRPN